MEKDLEITPPNDPSALDSHGRSTRNSNHEESVEDMDKSFRADASPSKSSYEDSQVERDGMKKVLGRGSSVPNPKRCAKPIVDVFYINGILNDEPDIKADAVRLSEIVKDIAKEIGIHINTVEMIYDPTDGVYDFVKVGYELFPPGTKIGAALKAFFYFWFIFFKLQR